MACMETANPNASAHAIKILNYLAHLPECGDKRVVSGQFLGHGESSSQRYNCQVKQLHADTGKWVAMVGVDYGPWRGSRAEFDLSATNAPLITHWNGGGLVTVTWHAKNPWTGNSAWNEDSPRWDPRQADLMQLITPRTKAHENWMAELDYVAEGLAELRDAGVVVIWRPFHEMNWRKCFWWSIPIYDYKNNRHPEPFHELWRHMYHYFTRDKGLHHLLWVYSEADNANNVPTLLMYPGDEYVDIVGVDIYNSTMTTQGTVYEDLLGTGKPFAIAEYGPYPRPGDNRDIIRGIRDKYPQTVLWQSWGGKWAMVESKNAAELLNDPWVITRDKLDCGPEPSPREIIINNTDAGFSTKPSQGVWQEFTKVGGQHYGDSHHFKREKGNGQATATWAFAVPELGNYDVYAWWWERDCRPPDVPYTINHLAGNTTVRVDQRAGGGQWNLLGTFCFLDEGSVVVSDDVSSGQDIVADAIRLCYHSGPGPGVVLRAKVAELRDVAAEFEAAVAELGNAATEFEAKAAELRAAAADFEAKVEGFKNVPTDFEAKVCGLKSTVDELDDAVKAVK